MSSVEVYDLLDLRKRLYKQYHEKKKELRNIKDRIDKINEEIYANCEHKTIQSRRYYGMHRAEYMYVCTECNKRLEFDEYCSLSSKSKIIEINM